MVIYSKSRFIDVIKQKHVEKISMDIILVNIPIDAKKKPYDDAFPFSKSINFGILSIASYLAKNKYNVSIFDPQAINSNNPLNDLISYVQQTKPLVVGLSCISGFAYRSFKRYATELKKYFPNILIIAGGQNHIGVLGKVVLEECEAVDVVVKGEGEHVVLLMLRNIENKANFENVPNIVYRSGEQIIETSTDDSIQLQNIPKLDIQLYHDFRKFPPVIEVSRGCPYSCIFCSSIQKNIRKKDIQTIVEEVEAIVAAYECRTIPIYFEAPILMMSDAEIGELIRLRKERQLVFSWRAETRIEYLNPNRIRALYNAGMKVVDVGLESGSQEILLSMNKTKSPSVYLHSLVTALPVCREVGLLMKLNMLFYVGENIHTLTESFELLKNNSESVMALSAYPLLLYPGSRLSDNQETITVSGGSLIKTNEWVSMHLTPVNPSPDFTYEKLHDIGILLGKSFQNAETFYLQKSHGYFSPGTDYNDFEKSALKHNIEKLPFSWNEDGMARAQQELSRLLLN
jgi:anaerobic magnesium-protoporphyrin IX monomethyl ester cyclase